MNTYKTVIQLRYVRSYRKKKKKRERDIELYFMWIIINEYINDRNM